MSFSLLFFILIAAISLAAAIGVVASRAPVHSALFLLTHFAMLAVLYVTLDAQFLGAIQVIVYAGGIVILILFVIMLIGSENIETEAGHRPWLPYVGMGLGILLLAGMTMSLLSAFGSGQINASAINGGVPAVVGVELYTRYILQFELVGILLLVALLGALLVARRPKREEQS